MAAKKEFPLCIINEYQAGKSMAQIAREQDTSPVTIKLWLFDHGCRIRSNGEQRQLEMELRQTAEA